MFILFTNCSKTSLLNKDFACSSKSTGKSLREFDFFENFSVEIPKKWKKSFYYDDLQSEIFAADTTKVFNETYMMEFALINGNMQADEVFKNKVIQKAEANQIIKIKDNFVDFKKKKGYYFYGKEVSPEKEIHVFQYYLKINETQYFMARSEIFGAENVSERLCESLNIINSIEFKKGKKEID